MRSGGGARFIRDAAAICTTFVGEVPDQGVHRRIVCAANERRRLTFLRNQPGVEQAMQVMGEGGRRDPELPLQATDRESRVPRTNQGAVDPKARRITQ